MVARKHRLPVVSTVHGFVGGGFRDALNERVQCLALRRADAVIAVSRPLVDRLLRSGVAREKIVCVPNGFDPPADLRTRAIARRMLGVDEHSLVAGWVGRLSREKGADVMLDALARSNDGWRLSVIGDGGERDRLTKQAARLGIADRVTWHGAVAHAGALMTAFDAFVLSSRTEGTPIALLEAMNAKVPVVAARVGGVPDVVTQDQALLVPPDSPATIAAALSEIQREPGAAAHRVGLAYRRLIGDFSAGRWVSAIEEVYRKACASMAPGLS
jgi:glycosyltransferase involved in cell wall biosynthesis